MKNILIFLLFFSGKLQAQQIKIMHAEKNTSIRGLSVVDDRIIWVSGSNGMVGKSLDSGNTWKFLHVKDFEKTDFRDIEAFDESKAVIMGVGEPAYMLRTIDGGENWKVVFMDKTHGMFLDAMEFWNEQSGIVVGDPIKGKFFIARTFNGGETWRAIPADNYPAADSGEACFAASGTNIRKFGNDAACFVTGGLTSRLFIKDQKIKLPIIQGRETTGANSIALKNKKTFIVVGGDFNDPGSSLQNCVITKDAGKTWTSPATPPGGYRSCIEYLQKSEWVTCGLSGVDASADDGKTWKAISDESFHVCRRAKNGKSIFLAGANGKIAKFINTPDR